METTTFTQITVKVEPGSSSKSDEENPNDDLPNNFKIKEEEIFIKAEIEEELEDSTNEEATYETNTGSIKNEIATDGKFQESISKLPVKKRKPLLETSPEDIPVDEDLPIKEDDKNASDNDNETNDQLEKADDDKPKEKYIMYSYEVTKNIQIMIISEEERQIEHVENLKTKQHMRYTCEHCAVGFVLSDAFMMHNKVHSPEAGDHECEVCHCRLKSADMLYRHKLRHYRRYRCLLCWSRFKDKDKAACHVMTEHIGTSFECDHCGREFKRPQYLKRHVEQYHTKPRSLECPVCFRVFHERGWYRSHVRTHNEELRTINQTVTVSCNICSRELKTKASLKRHLLSHNPELLSCELCEEKCKNKVTLAQHYVKVHKENYDGAPELTCTICMRVCATRAMLNRHTRRMHSDRTKKYQCDHCQRMYLTKGEVRSHITWSHMPVEARARGGHACPCGRVFRTPALLRDHTARRHEMLPPPRTHACDHCGKTFTNKQVLTRHKKVHSNEMYPCNECGLLFKTESYVKVHHQLKHLNMTRAEIFAQRKLNRQNRIAQNNIHCKPNWENSVSRNGSKSSDNDPLMIKETDIQIKLERDDDYEDVQIPLFQTFEGVGIPQ